MYRGRRGKNLGAEILGWLAGNLNCVYAGITKVTLE